VIVLDTHIWVWWVNESPRLTTRQLEMLQENQSQGLGVSIFSCWEVAKLVENNRLELSLPVEDWLKAALAYPGVQLLNISVPIVVASTRLEGFHRDPADQIIVATAKVWGGALLTADEKILAYPGITILE